MGSRQAVRELYRVWVTISEGLAQEQIARRVELAVGGRADSRGWTGSNNRVLTLAWFRESVGAAADVRRRAAQDIRDSGPPSGVAVDLRRVASNADMRAGTM